MNAHSKVNELEQFKAITHNLHFTLCRNILSSAIHSYITTIFSIYPCTSCSSLWLSTGIHKQEYINKKMIMRIDYFSKARFVTFKINIFM